MANPSSFVYNKSSYDLYIENNWHSNFDIEPRIKIRQVSVGSNPTHSSFSAVAHFDEEEGYILKGDNLAKEEAHKFHYDGYFVHIKQKLYLDEDNTQYEERNVFNGIITNTKAVTSSLNTNRGEYEITGRGLEYILYTQPLNYSWMRFRRFIASNGAPALEKIPRAIPFNTTSQIARGSEYEVPRFRGKKLEPPNDKVNEFIIDPVTDELIGNRFPGENYFSDHYTDRAVWNAQQIVEYLLDPANDFLLFSTRNLIFKLGGQPNVLTNIKKSFDPEKFDSIGQFLDHIISRDRGLGWYVDPLTNPGDPIYIKVFSLLKTSVTVPISSSTSFVVLANENQIDIDPLQEDGTTAVNAAGEIIFPYDHDYKRLVVISEYDRTVDRLIVQGNPIRVTANLRMFNSATALIGRQQGLIPSWTRAEEIEFLTGGTSTNLDVKDAYRSNKKYEHIFRNYIVTENYAGYFFSIIGNVKQYVVFVSDKDGFVQDYLTSIDFNVPGVDVLDTFDPRRGRSFLDDLPFFKGIDYSKPLNDPTNKIPRELEFEKIKMFLNPIWSLITVQGGNQQFRSMEADKIALIWGQFKTGSITPLKSDWGFAISFTPPWTLAYDMSTQGYLIRQLPQYLIDGSFVLCQWELLQRPYVERLLFRDNDYRSEIPDIEPHRTKTITLPYIHYWRVMPKTIIETEISVTSDDYSATYKQIHPDNEIIRDDTPLLRFIARQLEIWYTNIGKTIEVTTNRIRVNKQNLDPELGTFIKRFNYTKDPFKNQYEAGDLGTRDLEINSVVTSKVYDFSDGTETWTTQFYDAESVTNLLLENYL